MSEINEIPVLLHDTKRCWIYRYGIDGKITISKRFVLKDEFDLVEAIEDQMIDVANSSDTENTIEIAGIEIDERAFAAIDEILDSME